MLKQITKQWSSLHQMVLEVAMITMLCLLASLPGYQSNNNHHYYDFNCDHHFNDNPYCAYTCHLYFKYHHYKVLVNFIASIIFIIFRNFSVSIIAIIIIVIIIIIIIPFQEWGLHPQRQNWVPSVAAAPTVCLRQRWKKVVLYIHIMMCLCEVSLCLFVTKHDHFLLGVSCNHRNHP